MKSNYIIWFLIGLTTQALMSGSLNAMGLITISVVQQTVSAAMCVIVSLFYTVRFKQFSRYATGMAVQAILTSLLGLVFLVELNSAQQFLAAGIYGLPIGIIGIRRIMTHLRKTNNTQGLQETKNAQVFVETQRPQEQVQVTGVVRSKLKRRN